MNPRAFCRVRGYECFAPTPLRKKLSNRLDGVQEIPDLSKRFLVIGAERYQGR